MGGARLIVLDTCAIIWYVLDPKSLTQKAKKAIEENIGSGEVIISDISFWEIAWLAKNRGLDIGGDFTLFCRALDKLYGMRSEPISPDISSIGVNLPSLVNKDPADRIIVATALNVKSPLVTSDKNIRKSKVVDIIW